MVFLNGVEFDKMVEWAVRVPISPTLNLASCRAREQSLVPHFLKIGVSRSTYRLTKRGCVLFPLLQLQSKVEVDRAGVRTDHIHVMTDGDVTHTKPPFIPWVEPLGKGCALLLSRAPHPPRLLLPKVLMIGRDEDTPTAPRQWIDLHTVERLIAFLGVDVENEIDILQKTASNRNLLRT